MLNFAKRRQYQYNANLRHLIALTVFLFAFLAALGGGQPAMAITCDLSSLRKLVDAAPPGTRIELPKTEMRQVLLQRDDTAMPDSVWRATGSKGVIKGWNGAAFNGCEWYFSGGGHMDYGGNEVYLDQYGFAYDSARDKFALRHGDGRVFELDPEDLQVSRTASDTAAPMPARTTPGVYSRWKYAAALDAFIGMDNADEGFWLYRLPVEAAMPKRDIDRAAGPNLPVTPDIIGHPTRDADGKIVPSAIKPAASGRPPVSASPLPNAPLPAAKSHTTPPIEKPATANSTSDMRSRPDFIIPYSQGTLSFDRYPRFTVGSGGDFENCRDAVQALPPQAEGGVIEFLPGTHLTECGNLGKRGNILVTGRLGSNGERPRISTSSIKNSAGNLSKLPFLVFNSNGPDTIVVQNLDLFDTGAAINAWNYGGLVIRNVRINNTNGANAVAVNPTYKYEVEGYKWHSWMEIYDSEVSRGGAGNTKHNFYIGRIDRVLADNISSHSALNSHAFKAIARDVTLRNSTFATTQSTLPGALNEPYLSSTLIDIAACAKSLIENNTLIGLRLRPADRIGLKNAGAFGEGTQSFIDLKRRKTKLGGCDEPKYNDASGFDWKRAAARGYSRDNHALFHHVIRNNTFINIGANEIFIVRNVGTAYMEDNADFVTRHDLPLPKGWFERAVAWVDGNTLRGPILPGEEWSEHAGTSQSAPIFIDGKRLGVVH